MSLATFFTAFENDVTGFFKSLPATEQKIISEVEPLFVGDYGNFISTMLPVAIGIVTDFATSDKTSNEKRDAAEAQVVQAAETAGLSVLSGAAQLVVQAAYVKLAATGKLPNSNTSATVSTVSNPAAEKPAV